jgi:hypothetical protein
MTDGFLTEIRQWRVIVPTTVNFCTGTEVILKFPSCSSPGYPPDRAEWPSIRTPEAERLLVAPVELLTQVSVVRNVAKSRGIIRPVRRKTSLETTHSGEVGNGVSH